MRLPFLEASPTARMQSIGEIKRVISSGGQSLTLLQKGTFVGCMTGVVVMLERPDCSFPHPQSARSISGWVGSGVFTFLSQTSDFITMDDFLLADVYTSW
jgi:hypothetical protein